MKKIKVCDFYLCKNQDCEFLKNQRDCDNKLLDLTNIHIFEVVDVKSSWVWKNNYKVCVHTKQIISKDKRD